MDLVRRSQNGDQEAFEALFHQYKNLVFKTAYLILGDTEETEDALQEVFLKAHHSLSSFRPSKGAFSAWLHRITVNHCLNQLRRRKRRAVLLSLDRTLPSSIGQMPAPGDQVGERETVRQALDRLTEKQRTTVILRYYLELSYAEIAKVLGIPLGTVRSRLNQALKRLRRELRAAGLNIQPRRVSPTGGG